LLDQPQDVIAPLFAFCVASTLDSITRTEAAHPVADLLTRMQVDVAAYWKPTSAAYLSHVSKSRIEAVVTQAVSAHDAVPLGKLKKDLAAVQAEKLLAATGWVPNLLTGAAASATTNSMEADDDA
jgi:ParB family transcriptional regulator, chromosome partitioning protein